MDIRTRIYFAIYGSAIVVAVGLIVLAVIQRSISPVRGAYLIVLIALFAMMFALFLDSLFKGGRLALESNWGGLGGGLSGWRITGTFTFLLLSIALFALLVFAIGNITPGPNLWERYGAALNFAEKSGIKFDKKELVAGKLLLKGTAPSQVVANDFWNQVKLANGLHDDVAPDLSIRAPAALPAAAGGVK